MPILREMLYIQEIFKVQIKVKNYLSIAKIVELSQILNLRNFKIIILIIFAINYYKK